MDYSKKFENYNDNSIIQEIQAGNEDNFEILYKKYVNRLFRFVFRMIRSEQTAEEIVQDTFLKVLTNIHKYKITDAKFSTYLFTIAYNATINVLRSIKREKNILQDFFLKEESKQAQEDPYAVTEKKEKNELFEKIINALPEDEKAVFVMKIKEEMGNIEVAEILKISQRTVIRKMNSALEKIQRAVRRLNIL